MSKSSINWFRTRQPLSTSKQVPDLLLRRHDRAKAGYIRPRTSGLGDAALRDIFNAMCYLTRKADQGSFTIAELRGYVRKAAEIVRVDCEPDCVLDDFVKITCLIQEEGGECRFIHKSVQEYYAACFVKNQPEVTAQSFYTAMLKRWMTWRQELLFLSMIDSYRFNKWFWAPAIADMLEIDCTALPDCWEPTLDDVSRVFGRNIWFEIARNGRQRSISWSPVYGYWIGKDANEALIVEAIVNISGTFLGRDATAKIAGKSLRTDKGRIQNNISRSHSG
jgi:hypothetical protein